jgi:hypothetical protein
VHGEHHQNLGKLIGQSRHRASPLGGRFASSLFCFCLS